MSEFEQSVFISYAWGEEGDEREKIVKQLDESLQKRGLKIVRDRRDLGYKGSIRGFMERIGAGDAVIVVISDKYLLSKNCMYELVEIASRQQFADRIFPIILEDAKIYNASDRIRYVAHWEKEKATLSKKIRGLQDLSNLSGIHEELNDFDRFRDEIDRLTTVIKDMNCLTPQMLREADFKQLRDALMQRITPGKVTSAAEEPSRQKKERKSMDPITLATAATALLAPFLSKVGEKAIEKIAEQLPDKVGAVWNGIWNRLKEKPAAADAAHDLITNAEDLDYQQTFVTQLKKAIEKDESFASQLTELVEQAKSDPSINIVGDGVVASSNSTAVGKISIGGSVSGNFVIGNNNKINDK